MSTSGKEVVTVSEAAAVVGTLYRNYSPLDLRWAHCHLITTATAGNRLFKFVLYDTDGTTILYDVQAGATQAASLTRHYVLVKGAVREGSFTGTNEIILPLADIILQPGQALSVVDANAVDAADTFELNFQAVK